MFRHTAGYHRRIVRRVLALLLLVLVAGPASGQAYPLRGPEQPAAGAVEGVVELAPPAAARAGFGRPGLTGRARAALRAIDAAQRRLEARILAAVPGASVRWRYRIVLDGLAVVVPAAPVARLA